MRLALISDIHGNAVALDAVLDALAKQRVDSIVCLGDVAASGPQPCQVIERLRSIGCPVVMGNTDDWLLEPQLREKNDDFGRHLQDVELWDSQQLSSADREYLRSFQPTLEIPLVDGKLLLCYHGSPRSYREGIVATTPEDELDQIFAGQQAAIMAGGHTHMQMFRRYKDALIVNPGSVGLAIDRVSPFEEIRNAAWAEYAIIDAGNGLLSIELHRLPFDFQVVIEAVRLSGMPHAEWWISEWSR
ncbi:MAG TPA: metallophosphoesterase family protein [Ktedonobacteraceae bacterium]|nr:metallophosphoesterase family protein [Ktedonobacteraceae bacterium]